MGIALTPDFGSGAFELLLMRMEAIQLKPSEVRRIELAVFSDLANACATYASKNRCEIDLAYESGAQARVIGRITVPTRQP